VTHRHRWWLTATLATWALAPVALLLARALSQSWRYPLLLPDSPSLDILWSTEGRRLASAFGTSLALAGLTGPVSTVLGFIVARGIARAGPRTRAFAMAAALFPVIAPPIALGVGLQVVALQTRVGGTFGGVWLAHLIPATGYLTLFAIGVLTAFDVSLEDEARTLGASRWHVLSRVTVPLLGPRIAEGVVLGGLVSWGQLAVSLVIGGGLVRTLPVELLALVRSGNDQHGAMAALLLTLPPALALGVLQLGTRRTGAAL
jgi:putative spermidine/putrescine transport system permease protein